VLSQPGPLRPDVPKKSARDSAATCGAPAEAAGAETKSILTFRNQEGSNIEPSLQVYGCLETFHISDIPRDRSRPSGSLFHENSACWRHQSRARDLNQDVSGPDSALLVPTTIRIPGVLGL